tara:strand:+ start:5149 stop:5445 length:297 start_codon:yes stop_codon:yes gene_type:complete
MYYIINARSSNLAIPSAAAEGKGDFSPLKPCIILALERAFMRIHIENNGDESQDINVPNETKLYKLMGNYRERIDSLYQVIENQEKAIKTFEEIVFDK